MKMRGFLFMGKMYTVYILYSEKLDRFYIGATNDLEKRMSFHFTAASNKFTGKAEDWVVFFELGCENKFQALAIERHLKRMKSKVYVQNLKKYPEISVSLLARFSVE